MVPGCHFRIRPQQFRSGFGDLGRRAGCLRTAPAAHRLQIRPGVQHAFWEASPQIFLRSASRFPSDLFSSARWSRSSGRKCGTSRSRGRSSS
jgi:hypothetical protein